MQSKAPSEKFDVTPDEKHWGIYEVDVDRSPKMLSPNMRKRLEEKQRQFIESAIREKLDRAAKEHRA